MYKVLVFGMTENPGGVESFLLNYYRNIDRSKIQFDFLCNSYERVAYEDELISLGAETYHITARSQNPSKYKEELEGVFANNSHKYDAIWVNVCSLANIDYLKMAKKYNIKRRIIHSHNSQNMDTKLRVVLHYLNKMVIEKYATDFWACSDDAAEWFFNKNLLPKCKVIHNAIDISKMKYDEAAGEVKRQELGWEDKFVVGNIGRLHFQKNQMFVLNIFKELLSICPDARLLLVGQGEDEEKLRNRVQELSIEDKVVFTGVQYNISVWLSAMDFFLFPSVFEGLGIAVLESQANGVNSLTSAKVVPDEVVINENCKMQDLGLGAEAWAKKIMEMKENYNRLSYQNVKQNFVKAGYDIETEIQKLEELFLR